MIKTEKDDRKHPSFFCIKNKNNRQNMSKCIIILCKEVKL